MKISMTRGSPAAKFATFNQTTSAQNGQTYRKLGNTGQSETSLDS
jgi:hypothetical protein